MRLLIFGLGYTAGRLAARLRGEGWRVDGVRRAAGREAVAFDDPGVAGLVGAATHILSSVPPGEDDPVLARFGDGLRGAPWLGYLSSTGVYGDAGGAWVDEASPVGGGRRDARTRADLAWQALGARVFRLPGIYGPGRSALDRVRAGTTAVDAPGHRFSRAHVDDIVAVLAAALSSPATGVFNVADDEPAESADPLDFAADLLGLARPARVPLAEARLSPMAAGFYAERRLVAARRIGRDLGLALRYPEYRSGLRACLAEERR